MQTMYPGMVNSPQTELASAIDDSQTTIPLLDATVLPAAPNLATIGTGEDAETVLYEGVDGNDLTDVTRGFQGAAKAWNAGTKVARNFTAYDYDALRENVEDHAAATTGVHGATSAATPNRIVMRDANGRAKVSAPSASDDIARKAEVDAAQQAAINYAKQYGLGTNTPLVSDLNSLSVSSDTGFYSVGPSTLNKPSGVVDAAVIHIGRDYRPSQLLMDHGNNKLYYRNYVSSGWRDWDVIQFGQAEYDLPLAAGMVNLKTVLSSHDCKIYRVGNLAILVFALTKSTGNFSSSETIATLPSGLRPPVDMTILGRMIYVTNPTNTGGTYLGACEVNVVINGNVVVYPADLQGNRVMGTVAYTIT